MNALFYDHLALRQNLLFMIAVCLCVYFAYHALQGERGIFKLFSLNVQIEKAQSEYNGVMHERQKLEQRVVMLRPEKLNIDLLEERTKHVLGYRYSQEHTLTK